MKYSDIDTVLLKWAKDHGLHILTQYQDSEVRSAEIVDDTGTSYQVWLDFIKDDIISIHCWDKKKRKKDISCTQNDLVQCLENAYKIVSDWIEDDGKTRTIH